MTGPSSSSSLLQMMMDVDTAPIIDRNDYLLDLPNDAPRIPCPGPYATRAAAEIIRCNAPNQFVFEVVQGYHCCTLLLDDNNNAASSGEATTTSEKKDTSSNNKDITKEDRYLKQLHQVINGAAPNDQAGVGEGNGNGVVLSGDGKVMVVSSRFNNDAGKHAGHVRIFHETDFGWQQLGQTLTGDSPGEFFGFSIAASFHGSIIAIGTTRKKGSHGEAYQGRVQVYRLNRINDFKEQWDHMGHAIDGEGLLDYLGHSVALSDDGTHLAVGAIQHTGGASITHEGYVRVLEYHAELDQWTPLGEPMVGKESGEQQGSSISISGNGKVVAIAAKHHSGPNGPQAGAVRVYLYQHGGWKELGNDINGEGEHDLFGSSVALSEDGTVVAVGAEKNNPENKESAGHVRVFRYHMAKQDWVQLGNDIDGDGAGHGSGVSVSIGGNVVAVGAIHAPSPDGVEEAGQVRLFRYNTKDGDWEQLGPALYGEKQLDHLGHSVSLTRDGSRLAIGAPHADTHAGQDSGAVTMYEVNNL